MSTSEKSPERNPGGRLVSNLPPTTLTDMSNTFTLTINSLGRGYRGRIALGGKPADINAITLAFIHPSLRRMLMRRFRRTVERAVRNGATRYAAAEDARSLIWETLFVASLAEGVTFVPSSDEAAA